MKASTRLKYVFVLILVWLIALFIALFISGHTRYSFLEVTGGIGMLGTLGILLVSIFKWFDDHPNSDVESQAVAEHESESDSGTLIDPFEARKERAIGKLEERISLSENYQGDISLRVDSNGITNYDRKAMLYVFAKWAASEESPQFDSVITKAELREETELSGGAVTVFLSSMGKFLKRNYPDDADGGYVTNDGAIIEELDEEEMEIKMNVDELEEIVEYILGNRSAPN